MRDTILVVDNIQKSYGTFQAVKGVSFDVGRGEIFSLLGPNGAGKTTTISMLSGLIQPSAGDARINGHSVVKEPMAVKQVIGVVPQELALYPTLTPRQNLTFWGQMAGLDGAALARRTDELLEQVGLADRAKDRVSTFSGGMKRRLNIAIGLIHQPKLLFMDEPTVGIDPQSRRSILDMVKNLRDQGMSILYTTHYMEEAEELSDRVGIIDHGELIALGTQKELLHLVTNKETLTLHLEQEAGAPLVQGLERLPQVLHVAPVNGSVVMTVQEAAQRLPDVVRLTSEAGARIRSIDISAPNLEALFLHLTGRALRD